MIRYFLFFLLVGYASNSFTKNNIKSIIDIRVIDGDTVSIAYSDGTRDKLRLAAIDAPEFNQPFGKESTESLKKCIKEKRPHISWYKRDKYKRMIGYIYADGVDCNLYQLLSGLSWHYKQYQSEQPQEERKLYSKAEKLARILDLGIWKQECNIPPWRWRNKIREC